MLPSPLILIIEDEPDIARFIELELLCEGYQVKVAYDGMQGLMLARTESPQLILLDWMLPQMDGLTLCRRIRQNSQVPIILLTAKTALEDRVTGLDVGANDYLTKPFHLEELLARIRVQLRQQVPQEKRYLSYADLTIDLHTREVIRGGTQLYLSPKEFDLLCYFLEHPNYVLAKDAILQAVWGWESPNNVLEVCIHGLRDKLESPEQPKLLHTVRGIGYILKSET